MPTEQPGVPPPRTGVGRTGRHRPVEDPAGVPAATRRPVTPEPLGAPPTPPPPPAPPPAPHAGGQTPPPPPPPAVAPPRTPAGRPRRPPSRSTWPRCEPARSRTGAPGGPAAGAR